MNQVMWKIDNGERSGEYLERQTVGGHWSVVWRNMLMSPFQARCGSFVSIWDW
jgi:hypothetical protein